MLTYEIKDGKVVFECGCSFNIIGSPPLPKSSLPAVKFNPDTFYQDHDINYNCEKTWDLFATGRTKGIFQLEKSLGKQWSKKLKPRNIEHLGALGALLRPGCLRSLDDKGISMTEHYCLRKNDEEELTCFHPALKPALASTYFVMTYQEQSMRIARDLAGFTEQEADMLRKAISKKLPEEMAKVKTMFLEGCAKLGIVTQKDAEQIFDWIEKGQSYLFNKCLSKDTTIVKAGTGGRLPKCGYTVEHMYNLRNDINYAKQYNQKNLRSKWLAIKNYGKGKSLFADNHIKPNVIKDIIYSGIQPTYKITLINGNTVSATLNHKFPTPEGEKLLLNLKVGDKLFIQGKRDDTQKKYGWSNTTVPELRELSKTRSHDGTRIGFMVGENNPGYINGEFTKFKNNKQILPKQCTDCGKANCRLETHHIDGNRLNNELNNLTILCASCHKKREYAAGRVRKGQKGYFVNTVEIVKIEFDKIDRVYDVVMDDPAHNLLVNDHILTSNSHSIGYAILGYISAYTKTHFPIHFYTSCLTNAKKEGKSKDFDEIQELVDDAKFADIMVLPPDLSTMENNFYTDGQDIFFGLSDIKDVGVRVLPEIKALLAQNNMNYNTVEWFPFLLRVLNNISTTVAHRLIEVGALRKFDISRQRMLAEYDIVHDKIKGKRIEWIEENPGEDLVSSLHKCAKLKKEGGGCHSKVIVNNTLDLIKSLENPPAPLEDTVDWIAWCEKEYLGISLTCSELDKYTGGATHSCKDIISGWKGYAVLCVKLKRVAIYKTKKGKDPGKDMAFLTVADESCTLESVVVFSDAYTKFSHLLAEDNIVYLSGRLSKKDSFQVEKVYPV